MMTYLFFLSQDAVISHWLWKENEAKYCGKELATNDNAAACWHCQQWCGGSVLQTIMWPLPC